MCRRVNCNHCGKPSWAGCGAHVESVLGGIPQNERCQCKSNASQPSNNSGLLSRLFGGNGGK